MLSPLPPPDPSSQGSLLPDPPLPPQRAFLGQPQLEKGIPLKPQAHEPLRQLLPFVRSVLLRQQRHQIQVLVRRREEMTALSQTTKTLASVCNGEGQTNTAASGCSASVPLGFSFNVER